MAKKKIIEIPFDSSGQMLRRAYRIQAATTHINYNQSYEFEDTLQFVKIGRTSSSNYAIMQSKSSNKKYFMFMKDFEHMLQTQILKLGYITGKFTFVQRGVSYGIKVISSSRLEVVR